MYSAPVYLQRLPAPLWSPIPGHWPAFLPPIPLFLPFFLSYSILYDGTLDSFTLKNVLDKYMKSIWACFPQKVGKHAPQIPKRYPES